MAEGIKVEIVSPEKLVYSEVVHAVSVPGVEGYFTAMHDHAPFMTPLRPGFVTVTSESGQSETFYVRGGFADVSPEGLTVLAEEASGLADFSQVELEAEIKAAQEELERAASMEEKSYAQEIVSALLNLAIEGGQAQRRAW
ncbi:F0F1 ATP synthase subunit epsilon [Devosia algicola]|uniref:ATP synthase epsilon chain n=1 Tax=Devosia algicola TaxID=3026418 RepID=A0ABY7YK33_9HYPH|nr:F0F1 ATP synthase subunit epsilon [Devosia algicola]WDR01646.1 F0F1 ATP synthase subunit epsilon [Devosia algicola]